MTIVDILLFFGAALLLAWSANAIVQATAYIARKLTIKSFIMGFLVLGFATTVPEMFVAFQAVADGVPSLAIGNLLGGSILLLTLVMGGGAIFLKRIILDHGMTRQDIFLSTVIIGLPCILLWDGALTRVEGVILILSYIIHVVIINREQHVITSVEKNANRLKHPFHVLVLSVAGFVGLAVSTRYIVVTSERIATMFAIPPFVIGLFLITLGTNLPELTLVAGAIIHKKRDLAFGDVLGSAVINTPLLGIIAAISPFSIVHDLRMKTTLLLLVGSAVFFWWAASTRRDITRREGIVLLCIYLLFLAFESMRL